MAHLSLVTLGVADLGRATAFYEALGWRRSSASVAGTVTFFHGTPVLALFGREDLAADARLATPPQDGSGRQALAMNLATQDEVDHVIALAETNGATVCKRAEHADWGGYSGYFLDLDGHLWEVAHNPGFTLGPDGSVRLAP